MHELSLGTWFIHIATVLEWMLAIYLIVRLGIKTSDSSLKLLGIAMLPNLISAMAAITWHIYDNAEALKGLVVFQSAMTVVGNCCLALAAWQMNSLRKKEA